MTITPILNTLDEIEIKLPSSLKLGLQRLLQKYENCGMSISAEWLLRLLCAAWSFVMLFAVPRVDEALSLVEMLHGQRTEQLMLYHEPLRIEVNSLQDNLFWDISYYLMNSYLSNIPFQQTIMMEVRSHASMAIEVCYDERIEQMQQQMAQATAQAYQKGRGDQQQDEINFWRANNTTTIKTLAERNHIENHYTGDIERQYNAAGDTNNNPNNTSQS